jgi:hypothetical protein
MSLNEVMDRAPQKKTGSGNFICDLISLLDFLALEDGTDRFSQNVGKKLPLYAA